MRRTVGRSSLVAAAALFLSGCIGGDPIDSDGAGGDGTGGEGTGGAPDGSTTTDTMTTTGAEGGMGGEGGAPADDCPRARVVTPGEVLNVRPDPSTQGAPVGTLSDGTLVDVIEQVQGESVDGNDVWLHIEKGALDGYVSAVFAECTTEVPPEPPAGYYLPLPCGMSANVTQGNNGSTSHNGAFSQYAFDFGLAPNTDVVAMADGKVSFIYDQTGPGDPCYNGGDSSCGPYANYVVLRHADDTQTAYKHLNVVLVQVGQAVTRGSVVGKSGSTGWSTGRHLHAVRQEACGAANCTSIPTSFVDVPGNGGVPVTGNTVTSDNCPD